MKFKETIELFYLECSKRVEIRIQERQLKYEDIYYPDPKQICWIKNNKRTKNNRFLICDAIFEGTEKDEGDRIGLIPKLGFGSRQEVLWGTVENQKEKLKVVFTAIIYDLLDISKYKEYIRSILIDYVPYAKYSSYWDILYNRGNVYFALSYGISENKVTENIDDSTRNAINYLFSKCKVDFESIFLEYTDSTVSFKKISKYFEEDFIVKKFIPMISIYKPSDESLGLRVMSLIYADLSSVPSIIYSSTNYDKSLLEFKAALSNASSTYIVMLEEIQLKYIEIDEI